MNINTSVKKSLLFVSFASILALTACGGDSSSAEVEEPSSNSEESSNSKESSSSKESYSSSEEVSSSSIVNPGKFIGVAKYRFCEDQSGITIELTNGDKSYKTSTDTDGSFSIEVDAGTYSLKAVPGNNDACHSSHYGSVTLKKQGIKNNATLELDEIVLNDVKEPVIKVREITEDLQERDATLDVYVDDIVSGVESVTANVDGVDNQMICKTSDNKWFNYELSLSDLPDGTHHVIYTAKDKAGNEATLEQDFVVRGTTMFLYVDGAKKSRIKDGEELTFTAEIQNTWPELTNADFVEWTYVVEQKTVTKKAGIDPLNNTATLVLTYNDLKSIENIKEDKDYSITAKFVVNKEANIALFDSLKFGILSNNPTIIFTEPASAISVTKNDVIKFKYRAYKGRHSNSITVTWNPLTHLSQGISDPSKAGTEVTSTNDIEKTVDLAFDDFGTYKVVVNVKDDQNDVSKDFVTVTVFSDKPTIKASTNESSNEYKINAKVDVMINASDKFGTVNEIKWGCTEGEVKDITFSNNQVLTIPSNKLSNLLISLDTPDKAVDNYKCAFKAIDDDGEESVDVLEFIVK